MVMMVELVLVVVELVVMQVAVEVELLLLDQTLPVLMQVAQEGLEQLQVLQVHP
jgi:hypothetical protein